MPLDIKAEIAHRLEIDEQELEPVLETVVQRIRQQVAHYGYARLAGLGTFRGRDGEIVFEPDAVLVETVNLRFVGLEPIRVESPAEEDEAATSRWDERDLPEAHTLSEFEDDTDEEDVWHEQDEDEPPLGPVPTPAYEDAEFAVVGEQEEDEGPLPELDFEDEDEHEPSDEIEDESHLESAAMWGALGASEQETDEPGEGVEVAGGGAGTAAGEMDEAGGEMEEAGGEMDEAGGEIGGAGGERLTGPDRAARPHEGAPRDWPSKRTPSGLDRQASRRNTILIGAGVIVLVAAAAIVYFSLQPAKVTGPEATAQTEQPAETAGGADEATGGTATSDDPAADPGETPAGADAGEDAETAPSEAEVESTPLRSPDGIDTAAGGYTIVVFSETTQSSASEVVQRYREQGFRSDVVSSEEGGVTRYRVAVGQFETLEEAVDARNQLAGRELPQDAWVLALE